MHTMPRAPGISRWQAGTAHLTHFLLYALMLAIPVPEANIHAIYLERDQLSVKLRTFVGFLGRASTQP
jgi:LysR family transcriptional regulator, transcriptional activator for dmlA